MSTKMMSFLFWMNFCCQQQSASWFEGTSTLPNATMGAAVGYNFWEDSIILVGGTDTELNQYNHLMEHSLWHRSDKWNVLDMHLPVFISTNGHPYTQVADTLYILHSNQSDPMIHAINLIDQSFYYNYFSINIPFSADSHSCLSNLYTDYLLISGGYYGLSNVAIYNISSNEWLNNVPPLQQNRSSHGCATYGNYTYVFGGRINGFSDIVHSIESLYIGNLWNITELKWKILSSDLKADLSSRKSFDVSISISEKFGISAVVYADKIYVIGGHSDSMVDIFDPNTETLTQTFLVYPVTKAAVMVTHDRIYVIGGRSTNGATAKWQYYDMNEKEITTENLTTTDGQILMSKKTKNGTLTDGQIRMILGITSLAVLTVLAVLYIYCQMKTNGNAKTDHITSNRTRVAMVEAESDIAHNPEEEILISTKSLHVPDGKNKNTRVQPNRTHTIKVTSEIPYCPEEEKLITTNSNVKQNIVTKTKEWKCNKCTLSNAKDSCKCNACGAPQPGSYFDVALKILKQQFPSIPSVSFDDKGNKCFCLKCHNNRKDKLIYRRGEPPMKYGIPVGFARFGLKVDKGFCEMNNVFKSYHSAYHGTTMENVTGIFKGKLMLLKPGDTVIGGSKLEIGTGHIRKPFERENKYTKKKEMFDPKQIYITPSIKYASHQAYAKSSTCKHPITNEDISVQFVFQVKIRPESYAIGQETVGATKKGWTLDKNFSNDEIEWYTSENVGIMLQGLLLRFEQINTAVVDK
eukprot:487544_1